MTRTEYIQTRVTPEFKAELEKVIAKLGLTRSTAFLMALQESRYEMFQRIRQEEEIMQKYFGKEAPLDPDRMFQNE